MKDYQDKILKIIRVDKNSTDYELIEASLFRGNGGAGIHQSISSSIRLISPSFT